MASENETVEEIVKELRDTVYNLFCEYADCKIIDKENAK